MGAPSRPSSEPGPRRPGDTGARSGDAVLTDSLRSFALGPARVWCTDRRGGVSSAPFDALNLGDHVGDDPVAVARNRELVAVACGLEPAGEWRWMHQVHGTDVAVVDGPPEADGDVVVADALITATPQLPIAAVTADCAPIVIVNDDAVGVVHAGHRGLLAGVIQHAIVVLREVGRGDVRALLGPCIRAPRYEFGERDLALLIDDFGPAVEARTAWNTRAFDITAAVRIAMQRAGVTEFEDCHECTASSRDFFSYRRDGATGRQATVAVLT